MMRTVFYGSRDGAVARALTSHQCGPGHMWVKFVVVSCPMLQGFLRVMFEKKKFRIGVCRERSQNPDPI